MTALSLAEYASYDALGLAQLVREKKVSSRELVEVAISAIESTNPTLNAVCHPLFDRALEQATGEIPRGPFTGVPFLLKDMLDLEGVPVSWGSVLLRQNISTRTHVLFRRMQEAGLLFVGRTNMSELGLLPTTEPAATGPTCNPWSLAHSPGGSSGGSAAAVASGMVPMAHAADGGGSIRIPASACGLFGLKPSRGRNPAELDDDPDGFVAHNVLSRTVRDTAAMLDVLQGARAVDRWRLPPPKHRYSRIIDQEPRRLKIALATQDFSSNSFHPECLRAVQETAALLEQLGHVVEPAMPQIDIEAFFEGFKTLWCASAGVFFKEVQHHLASEERIPTVVRHALQNRHLFALFAGLPTSFAGPPSVEPFTRHLARMERGLTASDYWRSWVDMRRAGAALTGFLEDYDLLLTPVLADPPWPTGYLDLHKSIQQLQDQLVRYVSFTPIANTAGLPAMSVPLTWTDEQLPIGSHFIAPLGREDRLLQLAAQLEKAKPWAKRHPACYAGS